MRNKGNGFLIWALISFFVFIFIVPSVQAKDAPKEQALAAKSIGVDTNGDGKPDRFEYYESGVLVRIEADTNNDGKVDEWAKVQGGKIVSAEKDSDYDGKVDRWINY